MGRKAIVTGGSGFIGANLVNKLLEKKFQVHIITRENGDLWRLNDIKNKITVHQGILNDCVSLKKLFKKNSPFTIFHLAAYGSYPFQQDVETMIDVDIKTTYRLLECLRQTKYDNLIIAGSSSEYGKKSKLMDELDLLEPNNFYAAAKAAQTHFCQVFAKTYNMSLIILRLFNVYGPFEEEGRLVRSVIESVLNNKPVRLATGKEARDFIYVEDVADAFVYAASKKKIKGEIFNIGTGKQTTIKTLAQEVFRLMKMKPKILLNAYKGRKWDSYNWKADVDKTNKILGWKSNVSLEEGLLKTIKWYEQNKK